MASFDYTQPPISFSFFCFCFVMLIRAIVFCSPLGLYKGLEARSLQMETLMTVLKKFWPNCKLKKTKNKNKNNESAEEC